MKYNLKDEATKLKVIELDNAGKSSTEISEELGIAYRTIRDFLSKTSWVQWWAAQTVIECFKEHAKEPKESIIGALLNNPQKTLWDNFNQTVKVEKEIRKTDSGEDNSRILIISDIHIPYHHPDSLEFLQYLKDKYNPTRIICMGDELDKHALSFHDSDPNLPSAGDELRMSLPVIAKIKEMFPVMDILESNHGSLLYRKAHANGIPKQYLKSYNEVLNVDSNWKWWYDMTITLPNGNKCYFHHGKSANVTKTSQTMSMCAVQGHYHETFKIEYWGNPNGLFWAMQTGCLINDNALAFNYNNVNLKRPIIGTGLIIDSMPILEPMVLSEDGRWIDRKQT